jgi:hypothetical protein
LRAPGGVASDSIHFAGWEILMRRASVTSSALAAIAALVLTPPAFAQYTEVQVSKDNFGDTEYDWGRDGIYCQICNFGEGNTRFNWTDHKGNLWIGHIDPTTAAFTPESGKVELADTSAYWWEVFGNGPEWAFSTQNGQVISQLVYTRYPPGQAATKENAGVAFATPIQGGWTAAFFPGAFGTADAPLNTALPEASQCNSDPVALTLYSSVDTKKQTMYWEQTSTAAGTAQNLTPFGGYANGISERWVPCTHQLLFIGAGKATDGKEYDQVFWYDTDTNVVQQLSNDPAAHKAGFMFQAPEFGDQYVFFTLANDLTYQIYLENGTAANGAPTFELINSISSPDPEETILSTPEPFINCTPQCQTYIFTSLGPASPTGPSGNGLGVMNINPAAPLFEVLVTANSTPLSHRADPEYFITSFGPVLYYDRSAVGGDLPGGDKSASHTGHWYIDMLLGAPSGPCVGSSAEGGMMPGC